MRKLILLGLATALVAAWDGCCEDSCCDDYEERPRSESMAIVP